MLAKEIGSKIRDLRESLKLTQMELSERANIANRALQRLEAGENSPNLETLSAIASAMGVELSDFFRPASSYIREPSNESPKLALIARILAMNESEARGLLSMLDSDITDFTDNESEMTPANNVRRR